MPDKNIQSIGNTNVRKHLYFKCLEQPCKLQRRKLKTLVALAAILKQ